MNLVWSVLKTSVRSLLKDTGTSPSWDDDYILMAANLALRDFTAHFPRALSSTVAYGDISDRTIPKPDGMIEIVALEYESLALEPIRLRPGFYNSASYSYRETEDSIVLTFDPSSDITLYYYAQYDEWDGETDTAVAGLPWWAEMALVLKTCAIAVEREAISTAALRRWNQKSDSGDPEDNPLRKQADALDRMYLREIDKHKAETVLFYVAGRG